MEVEPDLNVHHDSEDPRLEDPRREPEVPRDDSASVVENIEAILLVSGRPVSEKSLATAVGCEVPAVRSALEVIEGRFDARNSGIVLHVAAGGVMLTTNPSCAGAVESFRKEARPSPLSGAAHEVLSCVLYLGPVTRGAISRVRGVNSDAVVRNLIDRNLLTESGRESDLPGSASLLDLTEDFFISTASSSRTDFPDLESLVSEEELDRVRERVRQGDGRTAPGEGG